MRDFMLLYHQYRNMRLKTAFCFSFMEMSETWNRILRHDVVVIVVRQESHIFRQTPHFLNSHFVKVLLLLLFFSFVSDQKQIY